MARWRPVLAATGRAAALAAALSAACSTGLAQTSAPAAAAVQPLAVQQVRPGVFVHFGRVEDWLPANGGDVANIGFVVGSRCVAVIDTGGTPQIGRQLRAAIAQATPLPVCHVINTHVHPDHLLGNAAFVAPPPGGGPAPDVVGHAKLPAALAARERYQVNALQRDFGLPASDSAIVHPTRGIEPGAAVELDLGDRVLQLNAWPTAHTDNDLTVYDRASRTLFLSDLLFSEHIPVVDGSLRGWLRALRELPATFDAVSLVVPGHGPASSNWPAALAPQTAYLDAVLQQTRRAIKNRLTIQQAVDRVAGEEAARWRLAEQFHRRNVTAAYAELEWEE